jgi:hypothetical protein
MTSQVNPNIINGAYPVAGQDNDSEGFRTNFTNIRNNFAYIKAEIEDIQNKAVLTSALQNSTLNNNFLGNAIVNPTLTSWREGFQDNGTQNGSYSIDFTYGNFQKITLSGATTVNFINFPTTGKSSIKLWVNSTNPSYTLTLPSVVAKGDITNINGVQVASGIPVFTPPANGGGDYLFEFTTVDGVNYWMTPVSALNDPGVNPYHIYFSALTTGSSIQGNVNYNTYIINSASSATLANLWFALPTNPENGREISITSLAPLTSCYVRSPIGVPVYWVANTAFSSGNVSVKLTYNTASNVWLRT